MHPIESGTVELEALVCDGGLNQVHPIESGTVELEALACETALTKFILCTVRL